MPSEISKVSLRRQSGSPKGKGVNGLILRGRGQFQRRWNLLELTFLVSIQGGELQPVISNSVAPLLLTVLQRYLFSLVPLNIWILG